MQSAVWIEKPPVAAPSRRPGPLRVALFSGNYNYVRDGANQALNRLVAYLEERAGAQVRIYSPTTDTPAFEPTGTLVSVPSVPLPGRGEYRVALGLPAGVRRDIRTFNPHLFHLSAPDLLGMRALRFARELGIPVVTSLHSRFESYFDFYGLGWLKPLVEAQLDRFYRNSDYVLVPNRPILEEMTARHPGRPIRVWGRGVDPLLYNPGRRSLSWRQARGFDDDDVVVLFLGRLVREKGIDTYVAAIERLRAAGHKVRPLVVGEGPARPAFGALGGAVLTGHLAGRELAMAIASADILLNPSTTEAFGNVVLEAMASGLAVVSADVASAQALIEHGETGLLCVPEDPGSYAEAVAALAGDRGARQRFGAAAHAASRAFTWEAALKSVVDVYHEALSDVELRAAAAPR